MCSQTFQTAFLRFGLIILFAASLIASDPVQFCRLGYDQDEVDFCMAVSTSRNLTTDAHDLFLSVAVTRGSADGWTAIGTGSEMAGSLMFFVFGDPKQNERPTVSIRTTDSHAPRSISRSAMGESDIQLLKTEWAPYRSNYQRTMGPEAEVTPENPHTAQVTIACYACTLWPGTPISANASSHPWIWAWNPEQRMKQFDPDRHLDPHYGGAYGHFYVNMLQSATDASPEPMIPQIQAGNSGIGASNHRVKPGDENEPADYVGSQQEMGSSSSLHHHGTSHFDSVSRAHGMLMGAVFLVVSPLGIFAKRWARVGPRAFTYHWLLQGGAFVMIFIATTLGMMMAKPFTSYHQGMGTILVGCMIVQATLGWAHHRVYLRLRHKTWMSYAHVGLGCVIAMVGWGNFLLGVNLSGHSTFLQVVLFSVVTLEAVGLGVSSWRARKRSEQEGAEENGGIASTRAKYFAIDIDDNSDEVDLVEVEDQV